jgi:hypothetical protein
VEKSNLGEEVSHLGPVIRGQSTRSLSQNSHWHHADDHYFFNSKLSNKHGVWSTISFKNLAA